MFKKVITTFKFYCPFNNEKKKVKMVKKKFEKGNHLK